MSLNMVRIDLLFRHRFLVPKFLIPKLCLGASLSRQLCCDLRNGVSKISAFPNRVWKRGAQTEFRISPDTAKPAESGQFELPHSCSFRAKCFDRIDKGGAARGDEAGNQ